MFYGLVSVYLHLPAGLYYCYHHQRGQAGCYPPHPPHPHQVSVDGLLPLSHRLHLHINFSSYSAPNSQLDPKIPNLNENWDPDPKPNISDPASARPQGNSKYVSLILQNENYSHFLDPDLTHCFLMNLVSLNFKLWPYLAHKQAVRIREIVR